MKDSKNLIIGMLCAVVCVMAVAYAGFSTSLTINGTASVTSNWNVAITNVSCTTQAAAGGQTGQVAEEVGSHTATVATFKMEFVQPGDEATCVITVSNTGSIPAKLNSILATPTGEGPITFTVTPTTADLASRATLAATTGTETITVKGVFDSSTTTNQKDATKSITVALGYVQATA